MMLALSAIGLYLGYRSIDIYHALRFELKKR